MVVRTFQLQDYMEVSTLLENNLSAVFLEKTITVFAKQLYWDSDLIVVAQKNNRIIGVIIGNIRDQQGLLYRIIVEGNDQNSEIERALVDSTIAKSKVFLTCQKVTCISKAIHILSKRTVSGQYRKSKGCHDCRAEIKKFQQSYPLFKQARL